MSWKVSCVMDERMRFVVEWNEGHRSMSALCDTYGISRKTGYKWITRYRSEGAGGLADRSRAPHHCPHRVSSEVIDAILERRDETKPKEGPKKICVYLRRAHPELPCPAASTIAEILREHGRVKKRRRLRPPQVEPAQPLASYTMPNDAWSADFKGYFMTGDRAKCTPLTISDVATRFLVMCQSMNDKLDFEAIRPRFEIAFREYGLPKVIRTDNGPPFGSCGIAGLSPLSIWLIRLDVWPEHIRPASPQDNGRHERLHLTLKQATAMPPRGSLRAQQRAFDAFTEYYNYERPHEALGQQPPGDYYQSSPRPFPTRLLEPEYPREWTVRKVKHKGGFKWGGHELFLGQALAGQHVGLQPVDNTSWIVYFRFLPLAIFDEPELVLRPYRRDQSQ